MRRRLISLLLIAVLCFTVLPLPALAEEDTPTFTGTLKTSEDGIAMIQKLEGFIGTPWHDVSQYSIGYGCSTEYARKFGFPTDMITKEQAHQLMLFVLEGMEENVDKFLSTYNISVTQYQYDALISLTYNIGRLWIGSETRLGKLLVEGSYTVNELASAFGIYCHTGTGKKAQVLDHLVSRRIQEAKLFLYGAYNLSDVEEKFCRLTYEGNVPPDYSDVALYLQDAPYQILFDPDPEEADGLYFAGWYTDYGMLLTPYDTVDDNLTVHAEWTNDPMQAYTEFEVYQPPYSAPGWLAVTEKEYKDGTIIGSSQSGPDSPEEPKQPETWLGVEASQAFSDIKSDAWYYTYVNDLYNTGVVNGYENATFRPNNTVTTGEALKMILLAVGFAEPEKVTDHWASGYHYLALDWAIIERGDITDLDVPITRAMMAKLAANSMGLERLYDGDAFSDTGNLYAAILADHGITNGYEDGTFRPDRSLTRAELSTIVWRIHHYYD